MQYVSFKANEQYIQIVTYKLLDFHITEQKQDVAPSIDVTTATQYQS